MIHSNTKNSNDKKENEALKQQLTSERLQKENQLLSEELLKKENIVILDIVPIKKEYKNCKRCLDKHTSENELCDECIKYF